MEERSFSISQFPYMRTTEVNNEHLQEFAIFTWQSQNNIESKNSSSPRVCHFELGKMKKRRPTRWFLPRALLIPRASPPLLRVNAAAAAS